MIIRGSAGAAREMIYQQDRQTLVDRCGENSPVIAEVVGRVGWARLWDAALHGLWRKGC